MKKKILLFSLCGSIAVIAFSSYHLGAALNGYDCTGAETAGTLSNPTGCYAGGSCHSSAATSSINVAIELDSTGGVPTTMYKPGNTYTVKITGTATSGSFPKYGFQLNALKGTASSSSNADAGTWATTGLPTNTQCTPPGSFTQLTVMEQSTAIALTGSSFTQSFTWTAPAAGTGSISFWGAANFVNGIGGADAGDKWNTGHITITERVPPTAIEQVTNSTMVHAFPNPASDVINLNVAGVNAGTYTVSVFDLSGRVVTTQQTEINGTATVNIVCNNWVAGLYQVVLTGAKTHKVISVVKQ